MNGTGRLRKSIGYGLRFRAVSGALILCAMTLADHASAAAPPPAVGIVPVALANVTPSSTNIGHVIAIQSVDIVPRVTAFIDKVNVRQGSVVHAGELLFTLQPAQFEAALQTAQASLASAQAALENAELVYSRAARLGRNGFEAQSDIDQAVANRDEDRANVLSANASVLTAALNLSYCKIVAPIDGRVGAVSKTKGNLVTPSSETLLTINQLDPIRVVFAVNSDSPILAGARAVGGSQTAVTSSLAVGLDLPNGQRYPYKGKIAFFDNRVDTQTGTVNVYADFPNPQSTLLPGTYVSVETSAATARKGLLVPVAAVQTDQNGQFVLVVGGGNKVEQRPITLGEQIAQNFIVEKGLSQGDKVITDGAQKVHIGEVVDPTTDTSDHSSTTATSSSSESD